MAFTVTRDYVKVFQGIGARVVVGKYVNSGGSTGGDITTGLAMVYAMNLKTKGAAVLTAYPVVNKTLPASGSVTIVTASNQTGYWMAIGS
jgi:hypothetical protein